MLGKGRHLEISAVHADTERFLPMGLPAFSTHDLPRLDGIDGSKCHRGPEWHTGLLPGSRAEPGPCGQFRILRASEAPDKTWQAPFSSFAGRPAGRFCP